MPRVHFLNVGQGDCIIIEHLSGRATMIDICSGSVATGKPGQLAALKKALRMCDTPTNPLDYLSLIGTEQIFRFILSHPDMDHLDGFYNLCALKSILNFWDSGVRKPKPDFTSSPMSYREEDWDQCVLVREGNTGTHVVSNLAGARFKFANHEEDNSPGGDGLSILAPNKELVSLANTDGDANDASYVILYHSQGGKVLFPGDAHDATWQFVLTHYKELVEDCSVLVAPHHGRKSDREYDFLDTVRPQLTLFGCAPSEHLAYDAWNYRNLAKITNNQAGNVVMEIGQGYIDVFVENGYLAQSAGGNPSRTNSLAYAFLVRLHRKS